MVTDAPTPTAEVHPSAGHAGSPVGVRGTNFGSFETVKILFRDSAGTRTALGSVTTDALGAFVASVSIPPNAAPGAATVRAAGQVSGLSANRPFTVT